MEVLIKKTHAQIMLERIEQALEGRASDKTLEYAIEGVQIKKIPLKELKELRDEYKKERESEVKIEEMKKGRLNCISVEFSS